MLYKTRLEPEVRKIFFYFPIAIAQPEANDSNRVERAGIFLKALNDGMAVNFEVAASFFIRRKIFKLRKSRIDVKTAVFPIFSDPNVWILLLIRTEIAKHFIAWRPVAGQENIPGLREGKGRN